MTDADLARWEAIAQEPAHHASAVSNAVVLALIAEVRRLRAPHYRQPRAQYWPVPTRLDAYGPPMVGMGKATRTE